MIAFPNCKINLGLNITRKREDNFHDIETVFYALAFTDVLEIIEGSENSFTLSGLAIDDGNNNLCSKAYDLVKKDYPQLPFIKMHLHKAIPIGAGLGGGSADAAFTLQLLRQKFLTKLTNVQLKNYALQLGSDCPFFLENIPCFASGRGEVLQPIPLDLSSYKLLLVNPGIHISTPWAFSNIVPASPKKSVRDIVGQPVESWVKELKNDFEIPVFNTYPDIKKIKTALYDAGAIYASLSGSGSSVYGMFKKNAVVDITFPTTYFSRVINLK